MRNNDETDTITVDKHIYTVNWRLAEYVKHQAEQIEHYRNAFNDEAAICAKREDEIQRLKEYLEMIQKQANNALLKGE